MSKKTFAVKLIDLHPTLKRTGNPPSLSVIYKYLDGSITIPVDLVPFIAEVLDASEQQLFDENLESKTKYVRHILESTSAKELEMLQRLICSWLYAHRQKNNLSYSQVKQLSKVIKLLPYAPDPFLKAVIEKLENIKEISS